MRSAVLTALLLVSAGARAQGPGGLTGVVVDATTQSPLAEAVVIAHSPALIGEQSAVTDAQGAFEMTLLPPGTYGLRVQRAGFQPFAPEGLVLRGHKLRIKLAILPEVKEAPPPPPTETAIEFNESMTPPEMISGPSPEYSQEAIERGIEGTIQLRCVITVAGRVRACKVLKGLPYMDRPVIDALQARRYKPALANGKPVDVFYTFTIRLKLPQ